MEEEEEGREVEQVNLDLRKDVQEKLEVKLY